MLPRRQLLGLGALAPLVLAGCGLDGTNTDAASGFAQGDGSYATIAPNKRAVAPTLTGTDLTGKPLSTADYAGQVIVLNVWGSWCAPCRKEAPDLVAATTQLSGVAQVLGINTRDLTTEPALAFVRAFDINFPSFFDPNGSLLLDLAALPANAIPSTLVFDTQFRIAARVTGATTTATLVGIAHDVANGK
jgi:thiol-disulfide isomerase/thioredoxin